MIDIKIIKEPLSIDEVYRKAIDDSSGAINIFVGTVRNKTKDKEVLRLEYEAYEQMAIKEMNKIANLAREKWPIENVIIYHRHGTLEVGDAAVLIAVSTPHRKESFEACQFIIDSLKQTVPIWKKEVFEDGEEWVSAHP